MNTILSEPTQCHKTNTSQILNNDLNPSPGNSNNTKTIINKIQKFEIINVKIQLELLELFNYRQVCFNLKIIEDDFILDNTNNSQIFRTLVDPGINFKKILILMNEKYKENLWNLVLKSFPRINSEDIKKILRDFINIINTRADVWFDFLEKYRSFRNYLTRNQDWNTFFTSHDDECKLFIINVQKRICLLLEEICKKEIVKIVFPEIEIIRNKFLSSISKHKILDTRWDLIGLKMMFINLRLHKFLNDFSSIEQLKNSENGALRVLELRIVYFMDFFELLNMKTSFIFAYAIQSIKFYNFHKNCFYDNNIERTAFEYIFKISHDELTNIILENESLDNLICDYVF
ncbi:hypothetical protein DMUE_1024 [Dictyocoela muelleri]|nr:hypothetical protein DMUE_1024 [Dictyocoela muelleri]